MWDFDKLVLQISMGSSQLKFEIHSSLFYFTRKGNCAWVFAKTNKQNTSFLWNVDFGVE